MRNKNLKTKNGYTIIETMIAVSLFVIIVMAGMGALLNANLLHQKSRDMRSIIDNLSFVMEDMSRSIRTGYNYYCIPSSLVFPSTSTALSGQNCSGIAFEPATGGSQWAYEIVSQTTGGVTTKYIRRSTDNGSTWMQLTPDEVVIDLNFSNFSISGAESPLAVPSDQQQPFVTMRLVGTITYKSVATPFSLQTSVSERLIDTGGN